jgi:5-methylcytosine-specific restriction endonuclease McrA
VLKEAAARHLGSRRRWPELRALLDRQNNRCPYCGVHLEVGINAQVDHIVPRARGGEDVIANYQWVDDDCNKMKRSMLEREFLARVAAIYRHRISPV